MKVALTEKPGPIGVFDSGYCGLTILLEIRLLMPQYVYLYLGDNARTPYGTRSFEVVYEFTREAVQKLFDLGCHLVILACNTASAKALKTIQQNDLPQMEMDKLCVVDHYPSDRFTFSSHGYDLHIENELVADAFAGLSVQEQSILILHFVLDLPDQEVGRLVGMSRSAVQRRRAKSLTELRIKLAALMPKGG